MYCCKARGSFRKENISPLVGDYVEINVIDEATKNGSIEEIHKRKNELIRPRSANIDQAIIVFAYTSPAINFDLLDRFIILAEEQKLEIVICINKSDLADEAGILKIRNIYESIGYPVVFVSAKEKSGIQQLENYLSDKVSIVAGPSGVGKSSIINCLNSKLELKTDAISKKIERGKHTTRHSELMELKENSFIVDSPGFTSLTLFHIEPSELQFYFREFLGYIPSCKFVGCNHISEPSCAVKLQIGTHISEIRHERYKYIYNELKTKEKKYD